jgi:quercetin dioxygenase-like cupin family protein
MKRAEHQPDVAELVIYAGIFLKLWTVADAGTLLPQHAHTYPHISFVIRGSLRAWRDEECLGDFHAPAMMRIPANTLHNFLTLTNDVALACIHNADHIERDEPAVSQEARLELED